MFWRKNSSNTASTYNLNIPFSYNHPIFSSLQKIEGNSFLDESDQNIIFEKLKNWFMNHKDVAKYISFYIYPGPNDDVFLNFRRNMLVEQIKQGIALIKKNELAARDLNYRPTLKTPDMPYHSLSHLIEVQMIWRQIRHNDAKTRILKEQLNEKLTKAICSLKITTNHLVSLLASIDAMPVNYLPRVEFSLLDINNETINTSDPLCSWYTQLIFNIQQNNNQLYKDLECVSNRFECPLPDYDIKIQGEYMHNIFEQLKPFFSQEESLIHNDSKVSVFYDYLSHPKCIFIQEYTSFINSKDHEDYWKLMHLMVRSFLIPEEDIFLLYSMFSSVIAPLAYPNLKFKGLGFDVNQDLINAFELCMISDPTLMLQVLYSCCHPDHISETILRLAIALQSITLDWKLIFKYIYNYTNDELIPPILRPVRSLLMEIVLKQNE